MQMFDNGTVLMRVATRLYEWQYGYVFVLPVAQVDLRAGARLPTMGSPAHRGSPTTVPDSHGHGPHTPQPSLLGECKPAQDWM